MKGLLVGTAMLLAAITLPASAESWRLITKSPDGAFFLDDDSVRTNGDTVYFSSLRVMEAPEKGVAGVKTFRSMSCARQAWRTRSVVQYSQQNKVISQYNPGDKGRLSSISSGSVGEAFYLELCR